MNEYIEIEMPPRNKERGMQSRVEGENKAGGVYFEAIPSRNGKPQIRV